MGKQTLPDVPGYPVRYTLKVRYLTVLAMLSIQNNAWVDCPHCTLTITTNSLSTSSYRKSVIFIWYRPAVVTSTKWGVPIRSAREISAGNAVYSRLSSLYVNNNHSLPINMNWRVLGLVPYTTYSLLCDVKALGLQAILFNKFTFSQPSNPMQNTIQALLFFIDTRP